MRQWTTGSFTLGISFIFLGIVLFLSPSQDILTLVSFLKWWPVLLILLGTELLISNSMCLFSSEKFKIKGISIFLILLILFISAVSCILVSLPQDAWISIQHSKNTF
ncbi:putative membrane protein [Clostridium pascui]|uniref:LiaF transmembrane domain-containing protein n=1 Tax=Clostridium pascui TaxID=46609 RepID=UPI001957F175|nr:DUF5668 domain-containing protein [Clostridium pascui]MBM7869514.1 putative membrane protein [Clostridium pascui]